MQMTQDEYIALRAALVDAYEDLVVAIDRGDRLAIAHAAQVHGILLREFLDATKVTLH